MFPKEPHRESCEAGGSGDGHQGTLLASAVAFKAKM